MHYFLIQFLIYQVFLKDENLIIINLSYMTFILLTQSDFFKFMMSFATLHLKPPLTCSKLQQPCCHNMYFRNSVPCAVQFVLAWPNIRLQDKELHHDEVVESACYSHTRHILPFCSLARHSVCSIMMKYNHAKQQLSGCLHDVH